MVFQLIRWVDLRRSLSTWRILKNMTLLLFQTDRFLHLQATLLKSVRLHPHWGQQLARSEGWMVSLHKNLFITNSLEGRQRKLDGAPKRVGRLCAHFVCLPPFMPANFKGQAGRSQGLHNRVCDPKFRSPRCCVVCSQNRDSHCVCRQPYATAGFQILHQSTQESSIRLKIFKIIELSVKSWPVGPELDPSFDASSPPGCCAQNHEILLHKGMKYWDSGLIALARGHLQSRYT